VLTILRTAHFCVSSRNIHPLRAGLAALTAPAKEIAGQRLLRQEAAAPHPISEDLSG
jgi:hypothetical protein